MSEKQKLLNFITSLDENLSEKDILNELLIYFKLKKALISIDENKTISNEKLKDLILKC